MRNPPPSSSEGKKIHGGCTTEDGVRLNRLQGGGIPVVDVRSGGSGTTGHFFQRVEEILHACQLELGEDDRKEQNRDQREFNGHGSRLPAPSF